MRVKTEAKRLSFIQAARALFVEHGVAAVSMEAISSAAGGSKVTLYNYFSSKEELFKAVVIESGKSAIEELRDIPVSDSDLRSTLRLLGLTFLRLVTDPDVVAMNRTVIAEANRMPELARIFYENGPQHVYSALVEIIARCMDYSLIRSAPPLVAALHFKVLCEAGLNERQLWGVCKQFDEAELVAAVDVAVTAFIDGYGSTD
ncbi:TetR/AcrR family transcriptional regulator [Paludibacterium yongneupense]|uniref:TetR/AcrR family transcriptional regulator n=1 Tax=Paludibacterium yongneupense TaxID=400061 RepID=UPI00048D8D2C|nr:TetR/AcrR family transcriptional regulator [Paludibacterium yongneupense]